MPLPLVSRLAGRVSRNLRFGPIYGNLCRLLPQNCHKFACRARYAPYISRYENRPVEIFQPKSHSCHVTPSRGTGRPRHLQTSPACRKIMESDSETLDGDGTPPVLKICSPTSLLCGLNNLASRYVVLFGLNCITRHATMQPNMQPDAGGARNPSGHISLLSPNVKSVWAMAEAFPDDDGVFVLSYCASISNGHDIIQDK
jgi:hypothetical protein